MSRPPTFDPPACAAPRALRTPRGAFAAMDAVPDGGARESVLLVPGYTGSKEDFVALLEPLSEAGYRAVAVDGRGQYESDGPDGEEAYAQEELAKDLLAQAEAVGGPVHLVGHSLGGQIARAAVLMDAAPFRSLTLMSSGPAQISPSQQERVKLLRDALAVMSMDEVWKAMLAMDPPEDTDIDGEGLRRRWMRHNPAQLIATGRQLCTETDRVDELKRVGLPVHVLSGETDDTWPVSLLDAMAERLGAHRTVITGAGHSPNTDRPGPTARALITFLNQC